MGLDQYATKRKSYSPKDSGEEIAYWRKHNRLQGWMEDLWKGKKEEKANRPIEDKFIDGLDEVDDNDDGVFNCEEVTITAEDLDLLEEDINNRNLPETDGFFYGDDSYEDYEGEHGYKSTDLEFIEKARKAIKDGYEVFYTSWW